MTPLGWLIVAISMASGTLAGVVTVVQGRSERAILTSVIGVAVVVFFILFFLLS
jgi:hypothetical protein